MSPSQLEIKTRALGRLIKEETIYHDEVKEQEGVIASMKSADADEYEIKKQVEVLEDTKKMIPLLREKIQQSLESLEQFLKDYTGEDSLDSASANIATAKKVLSTNAQ
ncbi:RBL2 [Cyberlindnera jadinii]|uniref:Tubulin-specific chaperone A n=1 Tax=Cyberlindnera jadinii (strain ATCC 18201 / CBS 1600 / BCRC 20928 / JCM 3617 / NBRC 0987 / NRRL Y-1542) TaxID=983966 RepID=A0A0H5BZ59_CYBJN|nr:tubulin binding cofactor A [Cyberlindnera jadinii NRRL Y-1542]ODV76089.1 tubulin binding cofactor A [Cyberlindnera jadinii NRRL Y-1542]CEP20773.1 RBL2 [Cyberlindnera jadinii]